MSECSLFLASSSGSKGRGQINFQEFLEGLAKFSKGSMDEKIEVSMLFIGSARADECRVLTSFAIDSLHR